MRAILLLVLAIPASGLAVDPSPLEQEVAALIAVNKDLRQKNNRLKEENDYLWQTVQTAKIKCD